MFLGLMNTRRIPSRYYPHIIQFISFLISLAIDRNSHFDPRKIRTILFIRVDRMGDLLMSMPLISLVREHFEGQKISILVNGANEQMAKSSGLFESVAAYTPVRRFRFLPRVIWGNLRALHRLGRFDLVIDLRSDLLVLAYALFQTKHFRIDWGTVATADRLGRIFHKNTELTAQPRYEHEPSSSSAGFLRYFRGIMSRRAKEMHCIDRMMLSLEYLSIPARRLNFRLRVPPENLEFVEDVLAGWGITPGSYLVVHPGAGNLDKAWRTANFVHVIDHVALASGTPVVIVVGPGECDLGDQITHRLKAKAQVFMSNNIMHVAAILNQSRLVLCNDSGIMHLSGAVGANTVAIFVITRASDYALRGRQHAFVEVGNDDGLERGRVSAAVLERL